MKVLMFHIPAQKTRLKDHSFQINKKPFQPVHSTYYMKNRKDGLVSLFNSSEFMCWKNSLSFQAISIACSLLQMPIHEGCALNRKKKVMK